MEVVFSMRILFQVICQNHPKPQRLQATSGVCTSPCLCDVFLYPSPNRCLKVKTWVTVVLLQTSDGPCWDFPRGYPIRGSGKTRITMWCGSTINFAKVVVVCQQKELSPSAGSFWDSKKRSVRWVGPYMVGYTYSGYHWNHWPTNHCHLSNIYLDIYIYINIDNENDQKNDQFLLSNLKYSSTINPKNLEEKPESQVVPFLLRLVLSMRLRISRLPIHLMWTSTRIDWISPPINPPADLCEILCSSVKHRCLRIGLESSHS